MKFKVFIEDGFGPRGYLRAQGEPEHTISNFYYSTWDDPVDAVKAAVRWLSCKRDQSLTGIIDSYVLRVVDVDGYEVAGIDCPYERGRCNVRVILRQGFPEDDEARL